MASRPSKPAGLLHGVAESLLEGHVGGQNRVWHARLAGQGVPKLSDLEVVRLQLVREAAREGRSGCDRVLVQGGARRAQAPCAERPVTHV